MAIAKLLTVAVPCYNSAAYMEKAVKSLIVGGEEMDVLLVDDGSTDETGAIADRLEREYPAIIRVIHQPNGGHGAGLNRGIETAKGIYFKVVDSDDRLDAEGLRALLDLLRAHATPEMQADLVVHDYVYDHGEEQAVFSIDYAGPFPQGRMISWAECRHFTPANQFLIHCLVYRVDMLREHHYVLPEHTFYEDNLYVYQPLPWVKKLLYLHKPVYAYNVGREGQSVNEETMKSRIDQQLRITRFMIDAVDLDCDVVQDKLRKYMSNYLSMMMCICSVFLRMIDTDEAEQKRRDIWSYLRDKRPNMYARIRHNMLNLGTNIPNELGRRVGLFGYRVAQKVFKFN